MEVICNRADEHRMKKEIFLRLIFTLLFSLLITLTFLWYIHSNGYNYSDLDCDSMEEYYFLIYLNIIVCFVTFVFSLTALLNLKSNVFENKILSLSSFLILPITFFLFILILFIVRRHNYDGILSFLDLGLSSFSYCFFLAIQYFLFRNKNKILCAP